MSVYNCKMCGGALEISEGMTVCECSYCGRQQTLPKTDSEQNLNLFNRANHFRQLCEFDKAAELYEKIAAQSAEDSDIFWSLVLCRYGIEYVDDPLTKKKIATCHRTQYQSILEDPDYLTALKYADAVQRDILEHEAAYIAKIQKGILEISNKEQPFDVFICYKENDEHGRRTQDSVLAQELYYGLVQEGFKVFFSRITLESKLGTEYEPYIFAALNSAKVMVVVGTKPEYFNAVWVRNEWIRYQMLMQKDRARTLIPAYKDMNPYDLPDALSMFQAQDMSKLGFLQDLIRGIKKIVQKAPEKAVVQQPVIQTVASANIENILKRGNLALEDGSWDDANRFFEQVLNENAEEPRAYIGLLCAEMQVHNETELEWVQDDFTFSNNYRKACRFGGETI
nr:toll/interleukin-1 receptor domain-containing protein [Oscillospiraceae bacterium]